MDLVLSDEEQLIKNWEYATAFNDKNTKNVFTVTDRRVIFTEESKEHVRREEITLDKIVGLSTNYITVTERKRKKGVILLVTGILLSFILVAMSIILKMAFLYLGLVIGAILIGFGIYYICYKKIHGELKVILQTIVPLQTYKYGLQASDSMNTIGRKSNKNITLKVNLEVANEIVKTLGSVILVK